MTSPPNTPPANLPTDPEAWRLIDTGAPCEWVEDYRPGGFHPVNLGDQFSDGRYKVIRKLGDGSYSTVWLAVDSRTPRYVTLKIMVAKASTTDIELSILNHLAQLAPEDTNSEHVTTLLDTFTHDGPNGTHRCLVFEPMGPTAASLVDELPENKPKKFGKPQRYPYWIAKRVLHHTLRGLAFLHQNGVVHGDVQPGNLLFAIDDISAMSEAEVKQDETSTAVPVERVDRKDDRWAPKQLYLKQSLHQRVRLGSDLCVKLSDLGTAFWATSPPSNTVTPLGLRAPELILHKPFGTGIDIWSFGCLIFEFLTGKQLFAVMMLRHEQEEPDEADDDHLIQINEIIGPLPQSIMDAWPRAPKWYGPEGQRLEPYTDHDGGSEPYKFEPLDVLFTQHKPPEINDEESRTVCKLVQHIFQYDPAQRPSAVEILKHPWFLE